MTGRAGIWSSVVAGLTGIFGSCLGAIVAGNYLADSNSAQLKAHRALAESEIAFKLMDFRAAPMAEIYSAVSKFDHGNLKGDAYYASLRELAEAAGAGAARLDGKAGDICFHIQTMANSLLHIPESDIEEKYRAVSIIDKKVIDLNRVYIELQSGAMRVALGEAELSSKSVRIASDPND